MKINKIIYYKHRREYVGVINLPDGNNIFIIIDKEDASELITQFKLEIDIVSNYIIQYKCSG